METHSRYIKVHADNVEDAEFYNICACYVIVERNLAAVSSSVLVLMSLIYYKRSQPAVIPCSIWIFIFLENSTYNLRICHDFVQWYLVFID